MGATASVLNASLITTDKDFHHLDKIQILKSKWVLLNSLNY